MNNFYSPSPRLQVRPPRNPRWIGILVSLLGMWLCSLSAAQVLAQQPAGKAPAAGAPAVAPLPLKKAEALQATINALAANGSNAAWDTLKKIVVGEIDVGELDRDAAQWALMHWMMRGNDESETYLLEVLCNAEQLRPPGKGSYSAADLRNDLAGRLAFAATPGMRSALADRFLDPTTTVEARRAIILVLKAPHPQNIPLQVRLIGSDKADSSLKSELTEGLAATNATMVQQALGIASADTPAPTGAVPPGMAALPPGFPPGGLSSLPPGATPPGGMPFSPPGGLPSTDVLPGAKMGRGLFGALNRVFGNGATDGAASKSPSPGSTDSHGLSQTLWGAEFAGALAKQAAADNSGRVRLLGFLASLPSTKARLQLHGFLNKNWSEGPALLAGATKMNDATSDAAFGVRAAPGIKFSKRGDDDDNQPAAPVAPAEAPKPENRISNFGENWFDPGALVILKSFTYLERPMEKPSRNKPARPGEGIAANTQRPKSAAAQKREEEREARAKGLESKYDWRDAIERYVHVLNERFEAHAQEPESTEETTSVENASAGKASSASTPAEKAPKGAAAKTPEPAVGPNGLPFPLHPGAKVVKEFHGDWPAASGPGAEIADPMTVRYLRMEEEGSYAKAVSHYRTAVKSKSAMVREIEDGRWLDVIQDGATPERIRSVDVFVTHTPADPSERKANKDEPLVIEVLVVEIPRVVAEKEDAAKRTVGK